MSNYTRGSLSNDAVFERRNRLLKRLSKESSIPSGSQIYSTTEKVQNFDDSINVLTKKVEDLDQKVDDEIKEIKDYVADELSKVKPTFPKSSIMWLTEETNPSDLGIDGTWKLKTKAYLPMTNGALYCVYERTG